MESEDQILEQYEDLFSSTLSSDAQERDQASQEVENLLNSSIESRANFIKSCNIILYKHKQIDPNLIRQTILYLNKAFSPDNDFSMIHNIWYKLFVGENLILRDSIKNICLELLGNQDEVIRELSCELLSLISIYDRGNFKEIFNSLVHNLDPKNIPLNLDTHLGSIITIKHYLENIEMFKEFYEKKPFPDEFLYNHPAKNILDLFKKFDVDKDEQINQNQFKSIANIVNSDLSEEDIISLFESCEPDPESNLVTYESVTKKLKAPPYFDVLLLYSISILRNFQSYNEKIIIELLEMLSVFVFYGESRFSFVSPLRLMKEKITNRQNMDQLFHCIFDLLQENLQNEDIVRAVHSFFFSLFENQYKDKISSNKNTENSNEDIPADDDRQEDGPNAEEEEEFISFSEASNRELRILFSEYINQINLQSILPLTNASYIGINFWNEIGKYEKKILKSNKNIDHFMEVAKQYNFKKEIKKREIFFVLDNMRDELLPKLLEIMESVSENYADPDDLESGDNYPYSYAASVFRKLFYFNPQATFEFISGYFEEVSKHDHIFWNIRYTQMLLISCACTLIDNTYFSPIIEFLQSVSGMMIQTIRDFNGNNMLVVTTLQTFTRSFRNYNLFLDPDAMVELLDTICQLCTETQSQTAVKNCIEMVLEIISCFNKRDPDQSINLILSHLTNLFSIISGRPDFLDSEYFHDLYKIKEAIIDHVNPENNNQVIIDIFNDSYQTFNQSQNLAIFINELYVLSYIMEDYGKRFIEQGFEIVHRLFELLNGPNATITEDCLECLIKIISGLGEKSEPFVSQLKGQISEAFQSQSPGIIIQVNRVIGKLFLKTGPIMYDFLDPSIDFITSQISEAQNESDFSIYFTRHIHYLIFPLAEILESISPQEEEIIFNLRDHLFETFINVLTFPKQDIDEQSLFIESMIFAFASVVDASVNDINFLKMNRYKIFQIIDYLYKLTPIPDNVLLAYCDFIECSIRVMMKNVILRKKLRSDKVKEPLIWAQCSLNTNLQERARQLIEKLL